MTLPFALMMLLGQLVNMCVTALAAFSVTMVFRTSTTTNFAQGSIAAFGCYVTADLFGKYGVPIYIGLIPGVLVGVLCGLLIDVVIFRNGKNIYPVGKQIITMGLVSIIFGGIPLAFGNPERVPFETFYRGEKPANIILDILKGKVVISRHALICLGITAAVLTTLFLLLKFSKWGLAVRATASNEFTAELMGINSRVITAVSWAIACALGVLAAVMYAGNGTAITASFMTTIQVNAFLACILGGFSTFYGPVVGAVCIPLVSTFVSFLQYLPINGISAISRWNMVIVYVLLLIVILIKPQGLFGKPVAKKV